MVKIEVTSQEKNYQEIKMTGHANAGAHGEDLVCAALTGIMSGALNAFDQKYSKNVEIVVQDNLIDVKFLAQDPNLATMIEMLMIQLKTIAIQYPQNVTIKEVN